MALVEGGGCAIETDKNGGGDDDEGRRDTSTTSVLFSVDWETFVCSRRRHPRTCCENLCDGLVHTLWCVSVYNVPLWVFVFTRVYYVFFLRLFCSRPAVWAIGKKTKFTGWQRLNGDSRRSPPRQPDRRPCIWPRPPSGSVPPYNNREWSIYCLSILLVFRLENYDCKVVNAIEWSSLKCVDSWFYGKHTFVRVSYSRTQNLQTIFKTIKHKKNSTVTLDCRDSKL